MKARPILPTAPTVVDRCATTLPAPPESGVEVVVPRLQPLKICGACGASYSALEWRFLPFVGLQSGRNGEWVELRNCACTSTIALEVDR